MRMTTQERKNKAEIPLFLRRTRRSLITFLRDLGIEEIEGIPLEDCHTFQLIRIANRWGWKYDEQNRKKLQNCKKDN